MSDLIANWIRLGAVSLFFIISTVIETVAITKSFYHARFQVQDPKRIHFNTHAPCRNSLAMLFYAVLINKRDIVAKTIPSHVYARIYLLF